jgi:hypothetical protein
VSLKRDLHYEHKCHPIPVMTNIFNNESTQRRKQQIELVLNGDIEQLYSRLKVNHTFKYQCHRRRKEKQRRQNEICHDLVCFLVLSLVPLWTISGCIHSFKTNHLTRRSRALPLQRCSLDASNWVEVDTKPWSKLWFEFNEQTLSNCDVFEAVIEFARTCLIWCDGSNAALKKCKHTDSSELAQYHA